MEQKPQKQSKEKSLLKVKTLKTYQPVNFNKQLETHFTALRPGFGGMEITFDTERQIIVIRQPDKDCKVVVPSNVEYMEIEGI